MNIFLQSLEQILDDISTIPMPYIYYIQHFGRVGYLNDSLSSWELSSLEC